MEKESLISSSEIADILEEGLARYSDKTGLLSGTTRKLMEGERRKVAILFLDLAGFTSLSQSLDHEVLHNIMNRLLGFLSSVVESFGGYVDKFEGDSIMALFGAKHSAENDSARAVSCALRMQDIMDEVGPVLPGRKGVSARIGVNYGSVTVAPDPSGHLTATGIAVSLASRIESMAMPGTILVTEEVKKECGDLFRYSEHGESHVRGLSQPVSLFIPLGPGVVQQERWQRAGRLSASPMVNRVEEKNTLDSTLQRSFRTGKSTLLRITGEAGMGKSRLLHEFLGKNSELTVLHGHTRSYGQPSFWIWRNLLRSYLNIQNEKPSGVLEKVREFVELCTDTALKAKLVTVSQQVADLLSLTETGSSSESSELSEIGSVAFKLMLDAVSSRGAVIVALEDIHWIDEPSVKVLRLFLESGRSYNPAMVVTTERPSAEPLGIRENDWTVINLEPLGENEIFSITGYILSDDYKNGSIDTELRDLISRGAKGNPFYTEELILGLIESGGVISNEDQQWGLALKADHFHIPSSVESLIQTRIDKLPRNERKMLQLASVIGPDLKIPVLDSLCTEFGLNSDSTTSSGMILKTLAGKGFLTESEDDSVSFRHDLVRISVYNTLLKHNRRIIHRFAAEALERIYPHETSVLAPTIFTHWRQSGDEAKTLEWAQKAMKTAGNNDQKGKVLDLAEIILDIAEDPGGNDKNMWLARANALLAKQAVLATEGRSKESLKIIGCVLEDAVMWDHTSIEASALRQKCILLDEIGERDGLEDLFLLAIHKAEFAKDEILLASIYSSFANYLSDTARVAETLEYYEKALAIFTKYDDKTLIAAAHSNMGNLMGRNDRLTEADYHCRCSMEISRKLNRRSTLAYSLNTYAINKAMQGDLNEARKLFEEALEYQIDLGVKALQASILSNLGILARMLNELEQSLSCYSRSLKLVRETGSKHTEAITLLNMGNLYRQMGEFDKALNSCRESRKITIQIGNVRSQCHSLSIEGMVELERGDNASAMKLYKKAVAIIEDAGLNPGIIEDFDDLVTMLRSKRISHKLPSTW
ncbi:MAG: tetratricopeptide repeat protein [Candidatus Sabulitectum sp.]|nr:tetratricopeptide repeat protein [Candidatus Sabulitectum sp.]